MARPLRIEFDGAWYHVMNRGAGRRTVFSTATHQVMFLRLLGDISAVYGVEVHAYCLMGNHYHLLLHTPTAGLGRAMRHLDGVYTQRFNRDVGTDGPLFRGRYKSVLIEKDSHLCCVSRYIHLNPLEAKLVSHPEEYSASSYRAYLGLDGPPSWLHTGETLSRFEPDDTRQAYRRFVESGIDAETLAFYSKTRLRPVLGTEAFRDRIDRRAHATGAASDPERPDSALVRPRPTLEAIADAVCAAFDVSLAELRTAATRKGRASDARGVFVLCSRELGGHSLRATATWVGYRSYAGASRAMGRARAEARRRPGLGRRVEVVRGTLTGRDAPRVEYRYKT